MKTQLIKNFLEAEKTVLRKKITASKTHIRKEKDLKSVI